MPGLEEQLPWEIFWAYNGWWWIFDRLKADLPPWAVLKVVDPSRPMTEQVGNADIIIPTTAKVGEDVILAAKKLKLVVNCATGYNNIAVSTCVARGIPVCTAPGINAVSTAEGALCCIFMLARKAEEQQQSFREGRLGLPLGMQLHGQTLGIIGMGAIGQHVASVATAMGMKILSTRSSSSRADLEALLRVSDVISVHCPLTEHTRGLLGQEELRLMKSGVILVNYSRGDVLDEEAVIEAVESGKLGGLGMDVHWQEPEDPTKPLYQHPNVISFPHTGVATATVRDQYVSLLVSNIQRMREGLPLLNEVKLI